MCSRHRIVPDATDTMSVKPGSHDYYLQASPVGCTCVQCVSVNTGVCVCVYVCVRIQSECVCVLAA